MRSIYHPDIYDASRAVPSLWEDDAPLGQQDFRPLSDQVGCDVAIIGGGYTGLSAALHLARDHGVHARVLEAGHIGWGASGRNAGFCCLAATKLSIGQLISRYGLDEAKRFYQSQLEAIELVRDLGEREGIELEVAGDGVIDVAHRASRMRDLKDQQASLKDLFGIDSTLLTAEEFRERYFDCKELCGALHVHAGFALNPMKFSNGLALAAVRRGAILHSRSPVVGWRHDHGAHVLETPQGSVHAERVIVATNGFTRDGMHPALDGVALPAISNLIATRPMNAEEQSRQAWQNANPVCTTRTLLNYYRMLPDGRFLFGARGDFSGSERAGEAMRAGLERRFREIFPGWRDVPVSHFWRGLICVTRRLTPCIGRLEEDESVWFGFGYHANGVNTAPWAGMMLARDLAGANRDPAALPAALRGLSPRFPFGRLRTWLLRGACLYYGARDAI